MNEASKLRRTTFKTLKGSMDWRRDVSHGGIEKEISGSWAAACVSSSCGSGCAAHRGDVASNVQVVFFFLDLCNDKITAATCFFGSRGQPDTNPIDRRSAQHEAFWGLLGQLEYRGREDTWVAGFVRDLMWPAGSFVREVLVMLDELDFKQVSNELQDILDQFESSFVSYLQRGSQREQASDGAFVEGGKVPCWQVL